MTETKPETKPSRELVELARKLRQQQTSAEKILWERLRNHKLGGLKLRRQHPIGRFVADFYCHEAQLVIEVDGEIHEEKTQYERDGMRTQVLEEYGLTVLRVTNDEVVSDIDNVLQRIYDAATRRR